MKGTSCKVNENFVIDSFSHRDVLKLYLDAVTKIGLWESEKIF